MARNVPAITTAAPLPMALDNSVFEADMGVGFEETSQADYAIPFLSILQALSPQCSPGDSVYDEECRPGMFFNSVTQEHFSGKEGLLFVPCLYLRKGLLWVPKNQGGGFRGTVELSRLESVMADCERDEQTGDFITHEGFALVDTREWYGLAVDGNKTTPVLMSLSKTQLKKSKRWLTLAQGIRHNGKPMPLFSQVYKLTTIPESNDKGSWMGLEFKHVGTVPSMEIFEEAKSFREMILSGQAKAAMPVGSVDNDDGVPY